METAAQGTVVGSEKIAALPLNGRQFIQLTLLVPGANTGGRAVQQNTLRQGQIGGLSVAGGRTNNTAFLLDGSANLDPDYNTLNYSRSVDAINEFQVQTAMVGAEYGRASVNVTTKSGTHEWHGTAWEFLRNRNFDSRPFNLAESKLPKYQRNQFGVALGNPVIKQRLFSFFSYEGLRIRQAAPGLTSVLVPTAAQKAGDFSASTPAGIFDPDTLVNGVRQPFPNNRIPANRIHPWTQVAMTAVPLPTDPTGRLFQNASGVLSQNNNNLSERVDFTARQNWNLFTRYSASDEFAFIPATITGRDRMNDALSQNAVVGSTVVLTPNAERDPRWLRTVEPLERPS